MKKGITVLALTIIVLVMSILAGAGVYFSNDIMNNINKDELAIELLNIQTAVDNYYIDKQQYPVLDMIQLSVQGLGTFELSQFYNEDVVNNTVTLNKLDLNTLGIKETVLGNNSSATDVYAVSQKTGKVYYVMGVTYRGETHYTLNNKLSQGTVEDIGISGKRIKVKDVIFVVSNLEDTNEAVTVTAVLPASATLNNISTTNSVQIGTKTTYGNYQLIEANTTDLIVNYDVEVTYTLNSVQRVVKYSVNNVDVKGPEFELSVSENNGYSTIKIAFSDSETIAKVKYELSNITDAMYFEKYGKSLEGTEINCYTSGTYTIYAVDHLGNATLKQQQVTVD